MWYFLSSRNKLEEIVLEIISQANTITKMMTRLNAYVFLIERLDCLYKQYILILCVTTILLFAKKYDNQCLSKNKKV